MTSRAISVMADCLRGPFVGMPSVVFNARGIHSLLRHAIPTDAILVTAQEEGGTFPASAVYQRLGLPQTPEGWAYMVPHPGVAEAIAGHPILRSSIVLGFGLTPALIGALATAGARVIDIEISPIRFGRRLYWRARTNCPVIGCLLEKIRLDADAMAREAQCLSGAMARLPLLPDQESKSLGLVMGQADIDLAIVTGGRVASWVDAEVFQKVRELARRVDELHIVPHPALRAKLDHLRPLLDGIPNIVLSDAATYAYFFDERVRFAAALSSSTIHEARRFGVDAHQLILPDRDDGSLLPDGMTGWLDVGDSLFAPSFWRAVMASDADAFTAPTSAYLAGDLVRDGLGYGPMPAPTRRLDISKPAAIEGMEAIEPKKLRFSEKVAREMRRPLRRLAARLAQ